MLNALVVALLRTSQHKRVVHAYLVARVANPLGQSEGVVQVVDALGLVPA